jgi:hypothetical protein
MSMKNHIYLLFYVFLIELPRNGERVKARKAVANNFQVDRLVLPDD